MALAVGTVAAALASVLYNVGLLIQAEASRREPVTPEFAPGLLGRLVRRRRWLVGSLVAVLGWPMQAFALTRAPLTVVQPMLAVGLLVPLAFGARVLGESLRRREVASVAGVVAGVSLLVAAAPPRTTETAVGTRIAIALATLSAIVGLALCLTVLLRRQRGSMLIVAAGFGFALASITTKLLSDAASHGDWAVAAASLAGTVAAGAAALTGEMNALQIRSASSVASLVFALETVIPVALSPLLFGETGHPSPWRLALRAAALATTIGAAFALARSSVVVDALAEA